MAWIELVFDIKVSFYQSFLHHVIKKFRHLQNKGRVKLLYVDNPLKWILNSTQLNSTSMYGRRC